jgi:ABC-type transport system substrate-binding protein
MLEKGMVDAIPVSLEGAIDLDERGFNAFTGDEAVAQLWFCGVYRPEAEGMPLSDIRVRQALSLAINRQEIIDVMFQGFASIPPPPKAGWERPDMSPELIEKWKAWAAENYRYDPDEANRLLEEAGYGDGFEFEFWSAPDAAAPYLADLHIACASYWEEIGAHANIVPVDGGTWKTHRNTDKSSELIGKLGSDASNLVRAGTIDAWSVYTSLAGSNNALDESPLEPEMDELYIAGMQEMDSARSYEIIDRMIEIATSSWTVLGVVAAPATYASGPRVEIVFPLPSRHLATHYADFKYSGVEQ